jgi:hypothetical protein
MELHEWSARTSNDKGGRNEPMGVKRLVEAVCGKRVEVDTQEPDPEPDAMCSACGVDPCPIYTWYLYAATHSNNPQ